MLTWFGRFLLKNLHVFLSLGRTSHKLINKLYKRDKLNNELPSEFSILYISKPYAMLAEN